MNKLFGLFVKIVLVLLLMIVAAQVFAQDATPQSQPATAQVKSVTDELASARADAAMWKREFFELLLINQLERADRQALIAALLQIARTEDLWRIVDFIHMVAINEAKKEIPAEVKK